MKPNHTFSKEQLNEIDRFSYFSNRISPDSRILDEASSRTLKVQLASTNLRHLWRRRDIRLQIKDRVYAAAVGLVLLCDSETWPMKAENERRLTVLEDYCLLGTGGGISTVALLVSLRF